MKILLQVIRKSVDLFFRFSSFLKSLLITCLESINVSLLLYFVFAANIFDAFLTLKWIELRVADEANPFMATLIIIDPSLFLFTKITATTLACLILWKLRRHALAKFAAALGALVYYVIILYHFFGALREGIIAFPTKEELRIKIIELIAFVIDWFSALNF